MEKIVKLEASENSLLKTCLEYPKINSNKGIWQNTQK